MTFGVDQAAGSIGVICAPEATGQIAAAAATANMQRAIA
jgi:hypothetical protein